MIDEERRVEKPDHMAPMPALAVAYRVPDPIGAMDEYLATVLLSDLLGDGDASRLYQRLVKKDQLATHVASRVGTFGDPFDMRDPTMLQLLAYHPNATVDQLLAAIDEEVEAAAEGVDGKELERVVTTNASSHLRRLDNLLSRAMVIAAFEQQRGRAELVNELPAALAEVTPDDVARAAATWLESRSRAILSVVPGGAG
jgi:predicted Zn-dependent peptidase